MSDTARDPMDIEAILARIARDRAESDKFKAEQNMLIAEDQKLFVEQRKLAAEQNKFWAEQAKLNAEAMKLQRDRLLSPWLVVVAIAGALGGIIAGAAAIARLMGWTP